MQMRQVLTQLFGKILLQLQPYFRLAQIQPLMVALQRFVAYCFAEVEGYSKFGSYTGNGSSSDGVVIHLGFKPKFFLLKATSVSGESWSIFDSARDSDNFVNRRIVPNNANAEEEYPNSGQATMDFLSNGVKLRASNTAVNGSGVTLYLRRLR
jgi:hypothetical protein